MDVSFLLNKTPEDIVKHFESKGYTLSWNWFETWQESHTKAFTVAKVMKLDILQDIRIEVENAIKNGTTFAEFQKNLTPILQKKGWWRKQFVVDKEGQAEEVQLGSTYRLKTIFTNNLNTSYSAGRYKSMWENKENKPYWRYISALLPSSRDSHKAMHNKVFRADDPIWNTLYPPNDFNCKCRVVAMSQDDIDHYNDLIDQGYIKNVLKIKVEDSSNNLVQEKKLISRKSGELQTVTGYRDPLSLKTTFPSAGWNYNVGKETYYPDLSKYDKDLIKAYNKLKDDYAEKQLDDIAKVIGKNTATYIKTADKLLRVKKGIEVGTYENKKTKIKKVVRDFLGNELYYTDFHYDEHLSDSLNGDTVKFVRKELENIVQNPEYILKDVKERAIIYGRYYKDKKMNLNVVVGIDSYKIFTVIRGDLLHKKTKRYEILFRK